MNGEKLRSLVASMRSNGAELTDVEAKSAAGGLPKSVSETLSAFSNGHGGVLILGLVEEDGFAPAPGFDAVKIRNALADVCANALEPPVRAEVEICEFEGGRLVVADVPELAPQFKPCYVRTKGEFNGSYLRGGDGDRRLTAYEIQLLHANRGQPRDDSEPVAEAELGDLNETEIAALLQRVRTRQAYAFANVDDLTALRRLNVVASTAGGNVRPTLAGLLALGTYPQQFFPQLGASFVRAPGESLAMVPEGGPRFLDNRTLDGPIPVIVAEAMASAIRNMALRSYVDGRGRVDAYEYPVEAVREAVVNALIHRDYSSLAKGSQVQIEMFSDRLVIRNPGGLFGPVTEADLGDEGVSSSRNPVLVKLLADVRVPGTDRVVCENRASGIPTIIAQMRMAGLPRPVFADKLTSFTITFARAFKESGEVALAVNPVRKGIHATVPSGDAAVAVLAAFVGLTELSRRQVEEITGLHQAMAARHLNQLVDAGYLVAIGARTSPSRRYRLAASPS